MTTAMEGIECEGFTFLSNFDSGNLAKVELAASKQNGAANLSSASSSKIAGNEKSSPTEDAPDYEFNLWTKPDCHGTEFENSNRTWFYFGIRGGVPFSLLKLNIVNVNKQSKMYSQGMAPVFRMVPGRCQWERIRDRPTYTMDENNFTLSFKYRTLESLKAITYFAFTYPFSYIDLQSMLANIDNRFKEQSAPGNVDDIYYRRECASFSPEGLRIDLLTISSHHGISSELEPRLRNLFPDEATPRPQTFPGKKIVFVSARVHPGETPSSFVFNGLLNLLLSRDDMFAVLLRKAYVFKLIPMLNPDGVSKGHYRTDMRGVNLNRVYLNPSPKLHPSVYAARSLLLFYHHGCEIDESAKGKSSPDQSSPDQDAQLGDLSQDSSSHSQSYENSQSAIDNSNKVSHIESQVSGLTLNEVEKKVKPGLERRDVFSEIRESLIRAVIQDGEAMSETVDSVITVIGEGLPDEVMTFDPPSRTASNEIGREETVTSPEDSGLFLYVDLHGHASKKGIFMYGNYFENVQDSVECMLLPKIMSINSPNFHFTACNFTERNMYLRDRRDGMSREGSGRVAVLKATGLVRSYTLECNYNTGRLVNQLPPCVRDTAKLQPPLIVPPKYTPAVFEEIGRALGISLLDLTGSNPCSRIPNSEFHTLGGIRDWLRLNYAPEQIQRQQNARRKPSTPQVTGPGGGSPNRCQTAKSRVRRLAPLPDTKASTAPAPSSERKENLAAPSLAKLVSEPKENVGTACTQRAVQKKFKANAGGTVLKQVLAVRTKCAVVGALAGGVKAKAKKSQVQRGSESLGDGRKKGDQSNVKIKKSSHLAKLRNVNMALNAFPKSKASKEVNDRKLISSVVQSKSMLFGDQVVLKGPKRMKITPPKKLELASGSGILQAGNQPEGALISDGDHFVLGRKEKELLGKMCKGITYLPDAESQNVSSELIGSWESNQELTSKRGNTLQKSSLLSKSRSILRKVGSLSAAKSKAAIGSTNVEFQGASCSSTKIGKSIKPKVLHLAPIKGKSTSFAKKKSAELVKKRGKVSLKALATSVTKFRTVHSETNAGTSCVGGQRSKKKAMQPK